MSDMRLVVAGAGGRMGRTLIKAIAEGKGLALAGAVEEPGSPLIGSDAGEPAGSPATGVAVTADASALAGKADGVIDFTVPKATAALLAVTAKAGLVHIIGTTGLSAQEDAAVKKAAEKAVIVKSGNMSLGVNLLAALVKQAAR